MNVRIEKSKKELFLTNSIIKTKEDSLKGINEQMVLKQKELTKVEIRLEDAIALAEKYEAQSKKYYSIANEANSNGENLFNELKSLCIREFKQPNLYDNKNNPNLGNPFALFYDFDKSNIRHEGVVILDSLIYILNQYPNLKVKIETKMSIQWLTKSIFQDNIDLMTMTKKELSAGGLKYIYTDSYAQNITKHRANIIVNYFINKGITPNRISYKGFGNKVVNEKSMKDYMGDHANIYLTNE
jgi:outer membrane protein OmpA-like peptidoglycan-associated protein